MFDIFREISVKTRMTAKVKVRLILTWSIGIGIALSDIMLFISSLRIKFLPIVLFVLFFFILYFTKQAASWAVKEFEYSLTNNIFTVDKIVGKKQRYPVASIDLKEIEDFGIFDKNTHDLSKYQKTVHAEGGDNMDCYITLNHRKHGHSILIFSPDQEMYDDMLKMIPPSVSRKLR